MTLYQMKINEAAVIREIDDCSEFGRRLLDFGIMKGQRVKCLHKGPFGSPIIYEICESRIALRRNDAMKVGVTL